MKRVTKVSKRNWKWALLNQCAWFFPLKSLPKGFWPLAPESCPKIPDVLHSQVLQCKHCSVAWGRVVHLLFEKRERLGGNEGVSPLLCGGYSSGPVVCVFGCIIKIWNYRWINALDWQRKSTWIGMPKTARCGLDNIASLGQISISNECGGSDSKKAIDFIEASLNITLFICCEWNWELSKASGGEASFLHNCLLCLRKPIGLVYLLRVNPRCIT